MRGYEFCWCSASGRLDAGWASVKDGGLLLLGGSILYSEGIEGIAEARGDMVACRSRYLSSFVCGREVRKEVADDVKVSLDNAYCLRGALTLRSGNGSPSN